LTADATYGAAATAWNTKVDSANAYTGAANVAIGSTVSQGTAFSLTTGVDNITGGGGNDSIIADNTATAKQLAVSDLINLAGGTDDSLKVYVAAADKLSTAGTFLTGVSNVENITINSGALTTTETADVSGVTGLTSFTLESPVAFANGESYTVKTAATTTLGLTKLNSSDVAGENGTLTVSGASTLNLNGVGSLKGTVTLGTSSATLTALTINSTGAASTATLTNAGGKLATLTITGDKALTLTESLASVTKIDASAATAAVKVIGSGATQAATFAFTGGSGNDELTMTGASILKTQTLDGGAGTADRLIISDENTTGLSTIAAGINVSKNFEVLGFAGTTAAAVGATVSTLVVDASLVTAISNFAVTGTRANGTQSTAAAKSVAGVTVTGVGNGQTFIFDASVTGQKSTNGQAAGEGVTFAPSVDNGSNVLNLTLSGVSITGGASDTTVGAGVSAANFETVNIASNANAAGTTTANTLAAGAGTGTASGLVVNTNGTVNISGAADLTTGIITATNVTVNAGSLTGKLTTTTGTGNDTIVGGSNVNTITLTGGVDTVDLSKSAAKADAVTTAATGTSSTQYVQITGFTNGATLGDKLDLSGTGTVGADVATTATGVASLNGSVTGGLLTLTGTAAATATLANKVTAAFSAAGANGVTNAYVVFEHAGSTYVAHELSGGAGFTAGTDELIQLVGLTGVTALSTSASAAITLWAV